MRIAVPTTSGQVSAHFGHCEKFALYDTRDGKIESTDYLIPPAHEPGAFPKWLKEQGADLIISGGMGMRALDLFKRKASRLLQAPPPQSRKYWSVNILQGTWNPVKTYAPTDEMISFGPVPSRRLGHSLGINNIPGYIQDTR